MAKAAQAAHRYDGGQQVNMKKYGVYGTDYGSECQHVLQQTPGQVRIVFHSMVFYPLPPGCVFATHAIVVVHPRKREVVMLYVEKDAPREAPESGDKKPQPVKK